MLLRTRIVAHARDVPRETRLLFLQAPCEGKMVCVFALLMLAALSGCSRAQEEVSEKALYSSETWQSSTRAVLVREQGE